jgi:hypothetical protein
MVREPFPSKVRRELRSGSLKPESVMYDIIGDVHGHADELVALLKLLGCEHHKGVYSE